MEEIRPGDYVRSYCIFKVVSIDTTKDGKYYRGDIPEWIGAWEEDIKSHSPNIIDLVEKDDYVNGYKVLYDYKETDKEQCNGEYRKCIIVETKSGEWKMVDWDIKSIVTKEQMEAITYHVI